MFKSIPQHSAKQEKRTELVSTIFYQQQSRHYLGISDNHSLLLGFWNHWFPFYFSSNKLPEYSY